MKVFISTLLAVFVGASFMLTSSLVSGDKLAELLAKHRTYCGQKLNDPAYDQALEDEPIVIEFSTTNPLDQTTTTPAPTSESNGNGTESTTTTGNETEATTKSPDLRSWFDDIDTGIIAGGGISGRIVGGVRAGKNEFPWQISMRKWSEKYSKWYHACGGSIIDNEWIITAAHCVLSTNNTDGYRIRVGEYDYNKDEGDEKDYNVTKIVANPGFTMSSLEPDVALIKLSEPIELSLEKKIIPICVGTDMSPEKGEGSDAKICVSTGWGRNRYVTGRMMSVLQKVDVPLVPLEKCRIAYDGVANVTTSMICSGTEGHATCEGDSGGPLQCMEPIEEQGGKEVYHLYGLTSFAVGCATAQFPSVNCRVPKFRDWVADQMLSEANQ